MAFVELLHDLANDDGAGRVRELLELTQVLVHSAPGAGALQRRADENGAIDGRSDVYEIFGDDDSFFE
jgi:hypothetical protein